MKTKADEIKVVLVTDCGSTTTKALLFEDIDGVWQQTFRGEAPTTVEDPVADVTVGARNAFKEIEELSGRKILSDTSSDSPFLENNGCGDGIDLYLSTSSAGGGLQMIVAGVVQYMTTESAERAALGAGAIVMDTISADDGREDHEKIEKIRHLRPDIVLLTGGVDSGSKVHVIETAEILRAAQPRPRFGKTLKLPVIFAGNKDAAVEVKEILAQIADVSCVENVRPTLEMENLAPARAAIHEYFLSHVMSHSPGYDKLLRWTPVPIMPTPAAVGNMIQSYAESEDLQVLCVDIGGATTDVFSVFKDLSGVPVFNRTVSANLGMSYSIANVLIEAGGKNIGRWLCSEVSETEIHDRLRNKMIRPTTIPQTLEDLWLEQAVCREALRLSLRHHRSLAVGLSGLKKQKGIADIFLQHENRYELVNMMKLDLIIGSGGVLSHAPNRMEAALMLLDGFKPEGLTEIAVDSIFMMPHLGVFATLHPQAAREIFVNNCLVRICHAVVPVYSGKRVKGSSLARIFWNSEPVAEIKVGEVTCLTMNQEKGVLRIEPFDRRVDVGSGMGKILEREITLNPHGLLLDGRNRPLIMPEDPAEALRFEQDIYRNLGLLKGDLPEELVTEEV